MELTPTERDRRPVELTPLGPKEGQARLGQSTGPNKRTRPA